MPHVPKIISNLMIDNSAIMFHSLMIIGHLVSENDTITNQMIDLDLL
jgi:hypothetical protein